jgi:hypothetical protein
MRRTVTLLLLVYHVSALHAAFEPKGFGAAHLALGGAGRARVAAPFSVFLNPAALPADKILQLNLYYRNFYGIRELNQLALEVQSRIAGMPLAVGLSRYGNALYAESELRVGTAYELFNGLSAGLSINGYFVRLSGYGNSSAAGISAALCYRVISNLDMAFVINNLNEPVLGEAKEPVPMQTTLSVALRPETHTELFIDLVQEEHVSPDWRIGLAFRPVRWLQLLAGFKNNVHAVSAGLSIFKSALRIDYGLEYHLELGVSNAMSVGYAF